MLLELFIRNFAVIRETRLEFARGLNALTGETGAGKSIVIDALGAVLGARTSSEFVRTGERSAFVEATFELAALEDPTTVIAILESLGIEPDLTEPLVLSREVTSTGRSTSRINGRTFPASALTSLGALLVDIHGQSDHLSLLRPAVQLDLIDHFAGTWPLRSEFAECLREWRALIRRIRDFDDDQRDRAQRIDLLQFQSEELSTAGVRPNEDDELALERDLLTSAERLVHSANAALTAIEGDAIAADFDTGALDRLRVADASISEITSVDPARELLLTRLRDALFTLEEVAAELRDFAERTEIDPVRLEQIDERLDLLRRLRRKYGPDLESVIAYAANVDSELAQLESGLGDVDLLRDEERELRIVMAERAMRLSQERRQAATALARRVEDAISELNMGRAEFAVRFDTVPDSAGVAVNGSSESVAVDATGIDRIAFLLAANAGEELRPLARVASGGETARLMLALKSILSEADNTPTLVFDEIDVGVGGRSGQVVGEKLWGLTASHQAIVISHLAQIAAFADRHLTLVKREVDGRTETTAEVVEGPERIEELAAMFDGLPPTPESRANAVALLRRVDGWKRGHDLPANRL